MRRVVCSISVLLMVVGVFATSAKAVPLPPSPLIPPVFGESDLTSVIVGPLSDVTIDWMVIDAGPFGFGGAFAYLYQLENTAGVPIDLFTVTTPTTSILASGFLPGDNLDLATAFHPSHVVIGEEEPFPLFVTPPIGIGTTVVATDVTWTFPAGSPLPSGSQSETLFFVSSASPTYGIGGVSDSTPPSPWNTLAPGGDPVPVPTPEPTSLLLLGSGLLGVGLWGRRRKRCHGITD